MTPEAIPVIPAEGVAVLPPAAVAALFGKGYALRGPERLRVAAAGAVVATLPVRAGAVLRVAFEHAPAAPLRLLGPKGRVDAPPAEPLRRRLVLPPGLLRTWGLAAEALVVVEAGTLLFGDVRVAAGEPPGLHLGAGDRAAAGLAPGATARLRRDVTLGAPPKAALPATHTVVPRRIITENDVRQARLRGKRLDVRPGQIVTPAARTLGRELGVLDAEAP